MFILNIEEVPGIKLFKCRRRLADWLMKEKHIPMIALSKDGKKYCFSDTELLQEVLEQKPFYLF